LTLTGFIGSDEPGILPITWVPWVWIRPEVSGAGSTTFGADGAGGTAAVASAIAAASFAVGDRRAGGGAATIDGGSLEADGDWTGL
jgi:hypothetical protein